MMIGGRTDRFAADDNLDSTVLLPAGWGVVRCDRKGFAERGHGHRRERDLLLLEVREHGLRALFRQPLIRLVAAPIVGVTFDGDVKIGLRGEDAGNPRQLFSGGCGQAAAAMISSLER